MLATLTEERFSRQGWVFEPKLDGERCLAFRSGGEVRLLSRNRKLLNEKYPELSGPLNAQQQASFIVDGEIVSLEHGVSSFAKLQERMQMRHPSAELRRRIPVSFYLFDLMYVDGHDTLQVPLRYRRELLRRAIEFQDPLHLIEQRETEGEAYYREACRRGWEGIIAKDAEGVYVPGRSREWLKFKCVKEQEFVIGGYTDPQGSRIGFGALLVGYYEAGKLIYAGKVGTGYDDATLQRLSATLASLETGVSPFTGDGLPRHGVHWVTPKLVAQVGFTEWTGDGKLRHPRFLGLRTDKDPKEVVREG